MLKPKNSQTSENARMRVPGSARVSRTGAGAPPNTVRISCGFENEWRFGVRASVLECGQSSAAFARRTNLLLREIVSATKGLSQNKCYNLACSFRRCRGCSSEGEIKSGESRSEHTIRNHACSQSGRGLPALQDAGALLATPSATKDDLRPKSLKRPVLGVPLARNSVTT